MADTKQNGTGDNGNGDDGKKSHLQPLFAIGTAVTTLAAVLGTLAFSGLLARLPRNHWVLASFAFGLVIVGAAAWTIAALFRSSTEPSARVTRVLALGIAAFTLGLIVSVATVFSTFSEDEKPRIKVRFDQDVGVIAEVNVGGLASDDQIAVKVFGLRRAPDDPSRWDWQVLYNAAVGPSADGEVDHSIELPIAPGTWELVEVNALTTQARKGQPAAEDRRYGPRCSFLDEGIRALFIFLATDVVNDGRKLTPFRRLKIDPPPSAVDHAASSLGTLPRSRSLSR